MQTKPKIVLVEDDYINGLVMQHYFEQEYEIIHISDGHRVIDKLLEIKPQVVILDINLGKDDIDGIRLLEQIRNNDQLAHTVVFAMTGYAMSGDEDQFLQKGFDRYLSKPVDFQLVAQSVEQALGRSA